MRSGIKFLAASGVLGIALGLVNAQDRSSSYRPSSVSEERPLPTLQYFSRDGQAAAEKTSLGEPKSKSADVQIPSRYRRTRPATAARPAPAPAARPSEGMTTANRRNYYRELFGEDAAVRPEAPADERAGRESQIMQAGYEPRPQNRNASEQARKPVRSAAAADELPGEGVIHAEYEQNPTNSNAGTIQQVRGTEDAFPQFQPPANNQTNPFAVEEHPLNETPAVDPSRVEALRREYEALNASRGLEVPPAGPRAEPAAPTESPLLFTQSTETPAFVPAAEAGAQHPSVSVQWEQRGDISVGQESSCVLVVRNTGKTVAHEVTVDSYFPETIRLTHAIPTPREAADHLTWSFASLAPEEVQEIQIRFIASKQGELALDTNVRFATALRGSFHVQEPMLRIAIKGPDRVLVGEAAPQFVTVTNPGTGIARNVRLEARIPAGLEHARGERLLMEIGDLNPGETQDIKLSLVAVGGGNHTVQVQATAAPDLSQATTAEVVVEAPSLMVEAEGPSLRYLGRSAVYNVKVTNDGTTAANNVRVLHRLPNGFEFLNASHGGKFEQTTRSIGWFVGQLAAGESTTVQLEVDPKTLGTFAHEIRVTSEQGAVAETVVNTEVDGTASLLLEIVDRDDPVEVGAETLYEIRVRNNGSKSAANVGLSCDLPAGVTLIGAKGPADHMSENGVLIFKNIDQLEPGKAAVYHVHVRGTQSGNHRFRAHLTSDAIQEPLLFEEITKFYQD